MMTRVRFVLVFSFTALVLTAEVAAAQNRNHDAAVVATVDTALRAGQSGDLKKLRDEYTPNCIFIDEFPPFHWSGLNAIDKYFASAVKMYKETQHSGVRMTIKPPKYIYVSGNNAYLVEPLSENATVRGKAYKSAGFLTFTLVKIGHVWKITSQIWTKTSENMNPYYHG
jgi:ketosteroid isomerase-like protein